MTNRNSPNLLRESPGELIPLPEMGARPGVAHIFTQEDIDAVNAAIVTRRPLLLRGEPGVGKSQLARAVAQCTNRAFVSRVVDARTEPGDLSYRYDAVRRLGVAQLQGRGDGANPEALKEENFIEPGPLWWAFDWKGAEDQSEKLRKSENSTECETPDPRTPWAPDGFDAQNHGVVVLIDEIDKADASVPNGLLEALGSRRFSVTGCPKAVVQSGPAPLVVITSNEERTLPGAFLRRCWVREIRPEGDFEAWLRARGRAHFTTRQIHEEVLVEAARQLAADRANLEGGHLVKPGQAEFLDLLRALVELGKTERLKGQSLKSAQLALLDRIKDFVFKKHPGAQSPR